jgi:serine/threonine protein kinase
VLNGSAPSIASDIYSLGVLLFHLVTGEYPVAGESVERLKAAHAAARCRRISELHSGLPHAFVDAVESALKPVPARTPTAATMFALLDRVEPPESVALDSHSTLDRPSLLGAADTTTCALVRTTCILPVLTGSRLRSASRPRSARAAGRGGR